MWLAAPAPLPGLLLAYLSIINEKWLIGLSISVAVANESMGRFGPKRWWLRPFVQPGLGTIATIILLFGLAVGWSDGDDWWVTPALLGLVVIGIWLSLTLPITATYHLWNERTLLSGIEWDPRLAQLFVLSRGWWTAFVVLWYGTFLREEETIKSLERHEGTPYEIIVGLTFLCYWLLICFIVGLLAKTLGETAPARRACAQVIFALMLVLLRLPDSAYLEHYLYSTTVSVLQGLAGVLIFVSPFIAAQRVVRSNDPARST